MRNDPNPLLMHRVEALKTENEVLQQNYELLSALLAGIIGANTGELRFKPVLDFDYRNKKIQWFEDPETKEMVFQLV